jgi:hypothetical protein
MVDSASHWWVLGQQCSSLSFVGGQTANGLNIGRHSVLASTHMLCSIVPIDIAVIDTTCTNCSRTSFACVLKPNKRFEAVRVMRPHLLPIVVF